MITPTLKVERQCQEHRSQENTLLGEPAQAAEKQKFGLLEMV